MSNIDKQALREEFLNMQDHYSDPADRERQEIYIAAEELLDELEADKEQIKALESRNRRLDGIIDAAERRIAELDKRLIEYAGIATREARRVAELEKYRTAFMEWHDKTAWVQSDKRFDVVRPLGKHRADVLREYIELISKNGNSGE